MAPLFDLILRHVPAPHGRGRQAVPHAGDDARVRSVPRPHADRPHPVRRIKPNTILKALSRDGSEIEQTRVTKVLAFRGLERVGARESPRPATSWPSPASRPRPWPTRSAIPTVEWALPAPADRSADPRHDLLGQRFAAGRHARATRSRRRMIRARLMREAEGNVAIRVRRHRERRLLRSRRPRRAAARRADRDHAPRGLRARRRPSARAVPDRSGRPASGWSRSRKS